MKDDNPGFSTLLASTVRLVCLSLAALLSGTPANAQTIENSIYKSKHLITGGVASQTTDFSTAAGINGRPGVQLTRSDLALDDRDTTFYLEYAYRLNQRWSLVAGTFQFASSGAREAQTTFDYDGVEFTAGSRIASRLEVDAYIFDLNYQVYAGDSVEVMVGGGFHTLDLYASISGEVRVDNGSSELRSEFAGASASLLAPVPNVRLMAFWSVSDRIAFRLNTGWLSANIDEYEGGFTYAHLRASYELSDNWAVSLGYQFTDVDVKRVQSTNEVSFDVQLAGPTLTATWGF